MSECPYYWIAGRLVPAEQATLPVCDLSMTRGYSAFELMRTYDGVPFLLEKHLQRFARTSEILGLPLPLTPGEMEVAVWTAVYANGLSSAIVRLYLTGGHSNGFLPEDGHRLVICVDPLNPLPDRQYAKGIALNTFEHQRVFPYAKSTAYLAAIVSTLKAVEKGFDEVVYVNPDGEIMEGTTFNVFAVRGKKLITPRKDVLKGLTGERVLKLARREKLDIVRKPISRKLLRKADEVFITSTNREIIPVVSVDKLEISDGHPGAVTRRLHGRYRDAVSRYTAKHLMAGV